VTFFNKKTEVMQIEMTPYGRYLYSIGKFKPHSYEFVDDDIIYSTGSIEQQEVIHKRILNETPKLKINRAFQDEAPAVPEPTNSIDNQRKMIKRMTQKQNGLFALGRSSYSSENLPNFQVTMLQGELTGSSLVHEVSSSQPPSVGSISGSVFIPQVNVQVNFSAISDSALNPNVEFDGETVRSKVFDSGDYVEIRYKEPIIHMKEFNSFYEKENFEFEVFRIDGDNDEILTPLKMQKKLSAIVGDLLIEDAELNQSQPLSFEEYQEFSEMPEFVDYFFSIQVDKEIPEEILCKAIDSLEVNSQFLDEELICPDQRTDRFNIYATRVGPDDLEDCD
tara:strand:+ start:23 stop:1027 length:1005 start_codon:yes stop_codon:yes gene_type:complete